MSLTITSTTYAGEHAMPFINGAFQESRTLEAGGVKIMDNIKYKGVIQNVGATGIIKDSACDFADNVTVTTHERVVEPKELMTTLELCKQDFHDDWLSKYQKMSAMDNIPPNFETYLVSYIGGLIGSELEDLIWTGDNGTDEFDGFLTLLGDAAAGTDPDQLPATQDLTFDNTDSSIKTGEFRSTDPDTVVGALQDAIAAVPNTVYSKGPQNFMLYTGFDPIRALVTAYGAQGNGINDQSHMWWAGGFSGLRINGVNIFVAPGINGNTNAVPNRGDVVATYRDNLVFGTGLMNDKNEASVIDVSQYDGSRNVRVVFRYTAGTQIGHIPDVVYYKGGTKKA